jgi:hypothetical protein
VKRGFEQLVIVAAIVQTALRVLLAENAGVNELQIQNRQ